MSNSPADIPTFVVVGQPNEGKTTVIATLAEDDRAEISNLPGTTRTLRRYPVTVDGQIIFELCDTPGFERPARLLEWLRENENLDNPAQAALDFFGPDPKMAAECEILKPLAAGAVALYVVDAAREPREVDQFEVEILRLCRNKRIGLINSKDARGAHYEQWRKLMERDFNHLREFNAHQAAFPDRIQLLKAVQTVAADSGLKMAKAIEALELDWDARLRFAADQIIRTQKRLYAIRHAELYDKHLDDKETIKTKCRTAVEKKVRELEGNFRDAIRSEFHHNADRWELEDLLVKDIFDEDVWRFLGLSKTALTMIGASVGGILGGAVDVMAGGTSLGLGILIGAIAGGTLTWLGADKAVDIEFPNYLNPLLSAQSRKLGGVHVQARVEARSNLGYILLDRMLIYVSHAANWSHGRRAGERVSVSSSDRADDRSGIVDQFTLRQRTGILAPFIGVIARASPRQTEIEKCEPPYRKLLINKLRELTGVAVPDNSNR